MFINIVFYTKFINNADMKSTYKKKGLNRFGWARRSAFLCKSIHKDRLLDGQTNGCTTSRRTDRQPDGWINE